MSNLNFTLSKKFDETYTISFLGEPQEISDNGYVFKTEPMNGIANISSFSDNTDGETDYVYFTKFYKYKNVANWSELIPLANITGQTFNNCEELELELYYYRTVDGNYTDSLYVSDIILTGEYVLGVYDQEAELPNKGDIVLLAPSDTYKIFSIDNFIVQSAPHNNYDIKFRFTQDGGRTYTPWESLTKENISTHKLSPIRFAQVEYSIENTGDQGLMVYDIILEGDFQNVSADYLKTNRYGLKEDCLTSMQNNPGSPGSDTTDRDFYTQCLSQYQSNTAVATELDNENKQNTGGLWKPYQFDKITDFANMLGNQVSNIFGWTVEYHLTDPDGNGIDKYMHEYTLKNIVDMKKIKVVVPDNKFPVESLVINQFNLDLFDTFEIQIMKDEFKNAFGITKRPAQDDIIYICEANMLYYVKHSQAYKDIMNAATYYKVILEKYEYKTNIRNLVKESQEQIDALTDNTTMDEIFGESNREDEAKIANKEQLYPTTFDKVRQKISSKVTQNKFVLNVDNMQIIKQYYDLSHSALKGKTAVNYQKNENELKKSDNRCFICWANFNNSYDEDLRPSNNMFNGYDIKTNTEFNLLNNYDSTNDLGYKLFYRGDALSLKVNDKLYRLNEKLLTNVWYGFVINLDQRQQKLNMYIYRRDNDITATLFNETSFNRQTAKIGSSEYDALINNGYRPVDNTEETDASGLTLISSYETNIEPVEFVNEENLRILGSDINFTNLRILDEVIPESSITNIIKEYILRDGQHVLLADNATKQLITRQYYNKQFR
ncbi:MAG: hypothetical protein M0Q88_07580 [Bacilli bacterium]|nr:hypothetical protein [Bacilli bacterium]